VCERKLVLQLCSVKAQELQAYFLATHVLQRNLVVCGIKGWCPTNMCSALDAFHSQTQTHLTHSVGGLVFA
jgi:hypothetical protein